MAERYGSMSAPDRRTSIREDADTLAHLGIKQELQRNFSTLSMLGLAFAILNSWTALAASISLALPSGGPSAIIWGLITAGICNLCLAASLAEFLSAYPTAGGQYHWAAIISWRPWSRIISWVTGWINTSGWIALTATGGLLGSQTILGMITFMNPNFQSRPWQQFLVYIAYTLAAFLINTFLNRFLPLINKSAFIWSITGFAIITITILACASPNYQSGSFVYGSLINETGWPDGLAWLLGLLQGALGLTGFDATAHMIEEMPSPQVEGPRLMMFAIGIGMFTGFVFLSALLFVLKDVEVVVASKAGPLLQIFFDATNSRAGAICLMMFPLVCLLFATISIMTTSSRMTYAFARDRGIPFSKVFAKVHANLDVPLNSLMLTTALVIIFGCIFLGSSSAFNAITAASVVALGISYAIPPLINVLRGRKMLPDNRAFILPGPLGWICNLVGIAWAILTTVLFAFPPFLPVTGSNMNYCIVAFAIIMIISTIQWFVDGRNNYHGPQLEEGVLQNMEVEGLRVETRPETMDRPDKKDD